MAKQLGCVAKSEGSGFRQCDLRNGKSSKIAGSAKSEGSGFRRCDLKNTERNQNSWEGSPKVTTQGFANVFLKIQNVAK